MVLVFSQRNWSLKFNLIIFCLSWWCRVLFKNCCVCVLHSYWNLVLVGGTCVTFVAYQRQWGEVSEREKKREREEEKLGYTRICLGMCTFLEESRLAQFLATTRTLSWQHRVSWQWPTTLGKESVVYSC